MRFLVSLLLCYLSISMAQAYDVENARQINKSCALCHGDFGQGTPDALSPRIAGLPLGYQIEELKAFRDGSRRYDPMIMVSNITMEHFTNKDIYDISRYLAEIDLDAMNLPVIPLFPGDVEEGKKIYRKECSMCHRKTGRGIPRINIPMVTGQYGNYLFRQLKKFQSRERYHDNDPEDDSFDEFDDATLRSVVAYLTHLTNEQATERRLAAQEKENIRFTRIKTKFIADRKAQLETLKTATSLAELASLAKHDKVSTTNYKNILRIQAELGEMLKGGADDDSQFAGRFTVTAKGEIILSPTQKDLRMLVGVSGNFRVNKEGGFEFVPEPSD